LMRRTHVVFAAGAASAAAWWLGFCPVDARSLWLLYWGLAGSVLPDADLRMRHRALLHNVAALSLLAAAVYAAFAWLGSRYAALLAAAGLAIGLASHVFLDAFTVRGVALLYPFSRRYYRLARLRSSSRAANAFFATLGAAVLVAYLAACGGVALR